MDEPVQCTHTNSLDDKNLGVTFVVQCQLIAGHEGFHKAMVPTILGGGAVCAWAPGFVRDPHKGEG